MEQAMVVYSVRLEQVLIEKLQRECGSAGVSNFIREALREKLSRVNLENKEFNFLLREIKKIDPLAMHSDMKDLLFDSVRAKIINLLRTAE